MPELRYSWEPVHVCEELATLLLKLPSTSRVFPEESAKLEALESVVEAVDVAFCVIVQPPEELLNCKAKKFEEPAFIVFPVAVASKITVLPEGVKVPLFAQLPSILRSMRSDAIKVPFALIVRSFVKSIVGSFAVAVTVTAFAPSPTVVVPLVKVPASMVYVGEVDVGAKKMDA